MKTGTITRFTAAGVMLASLLVLPLTSGAEGDANRIEKAYQLRVTGNPDSARTILEQTLLADTTNAAAWYGLARVHHQIGLGNPLSLLREFEVLDRLARKAVRYDPDNLAYTYYKAYISFFRAYGSLMREQQDAPERIAEVIAAYQAVLELDPDFHEARLYLIEVLSAPEEIGGDLDEAVVHVNRLEERDPIMGAKARDIVLGEEVDRVQFWQKKLEEHPGNAEVMEQLGKAYLYKSKTEEGVQQLEEALQADPARQYLLLDIAKYHMMAFRMDPSQGETALTKARAAIERYLETDPIGPLKAYALNAWSRIERNLGAEEVAEMLLAEATEADPHVSKAFAPPPAILFTKPGEVSHFHRYFSRPY